MRTSRLILVFSLLASSLMTSGNCFAQAQLSPFVDNIPTVTGAGAIINSSVPLYLRDWVATMISNPGYWVNLPGQTLPDFNAGGVVWQRGLSTLGREELAPQQIMNILNGITNAFPNHVEILDRSNYTLSSFYRAAFRTNMYGRPLALRGILPGNMNLQQWVEAMTYFEGATPPPVQLIKYTESGAMMFNTAGDGYEQLRQYQSFVNQVLKTNTTLPVSSNGYAILNQFNQIASRFTYGRPLYGYPPPITNLDALKADFDNLAAQASLLNNGVGSVANQIIRGGTTGLKVLETIGIQAETNTVEAQESMALAKMALRSSAVIAALGSIGASASTYLIGAAAGVTPAFVAGTLSAGGLWALEAAAKADAQKLHDQSVACGCRDNIYCGMTCAMTGMTATQQKQLQDAGTQPKIISPQAGHFIPITPLKANAYYTGQNATDFTPVAVTAQTTTGNMVTNNQGIQMTPTFVDTINIPITGDLGTDTSEHVAELDYSSVGVETQSTCQTGDQCNFASNLVYDARQDTTAALFKYSDGDYLNTYTNQMTQGGGGNGNGDGGGGFQCGQDGSACYY